MKKKDVRPQASEERGRIGNGRKIGGRIGNGRKIDNGLERKKREVDNRCKKLHKNVWKSLCISGKFFLSFFVYFLYF